MRLHLLCATILLSALTILPVKASQWQLVAVPQTTGKEGSVLTISKPFQVILNNTSLHDLKVWKEWCSWGYFNLSFEFTDEKGKVAVIRKNGMIWYGNKPDGMVIQPGCAYSITVNLSGKNDIGWQAWTGVNALHGKMTMRVIYTNSKEFTIGGNPTTKSAYASDLDKQVNSAWFGTVKSEPIPVTIVR
jgi:hypothetical protein